MCEVANRQTNRQTQGKTISFSEVIILNVKRPSESGVLFHETELHSENETEQYHCIIQSDATSLVVLG